MLESPDLSMAVANFLHENPDPWRKMIIWMRSCNLPNLENHITLLWEHVKIAKSWKESLFFSQTDTLFKKFYYFWKSPVAFKNKAFVYDLKACTNTDGWVCSTWQVAVVLTGSPSNMCCRVPGGGKVVMQAGTALEPYNALSHLYQSGRPRHMYNFLF